MSKKKPVEVEVAAISAAYLKSQKEKVHLAEVYLNVRQAEQLAHAADAELVEAVKRLAVIRGVNLDGPESWNFDLDTMSFRKAE